MHCTGHNTQWPGMQRWLFTDEALFPVCSPAYLEKYGMFSQSEDLINHTLLHLEERYHQRFDWKKWFKHFSLDANKIPEGWVSNDYSIVIQAALEGQGIAIGWRHIVQPLIDQGLLLRPIPHIIKTRHPFYILATNNKPLSDDAMALRDWLIAEMQ